MKKFIISKKGFASLIAIIITVIIVIWGSYSIYKNFDRVNFLKTLSGEIVYMKRDNGILNIYKIFADGSNKKLLYHNEDKINSNSMSPLWSEDGLKIYFGAMKDGKWEGFSIDPDGNNLVIVQDNEWLLFYSNWRLNKCAVCVENKKRNLDIREGSLYYLNEAGKEITIYSFKNYDSKWNVGANNPSWSPDKRFIIFESCKFSMGCNIYIANKDGTKTVKLTKGRDPDWK